MKENLFWHLKAFYDYLIKYNKNLPQNKQIFLNGDDIVLWKYIFDFYISENEIIKEKIINNKRHIWIAHKKILDDVLFLRAGTKRALIDKINRLKYLSLIYTHKDTKEVNTSYFAIPDNILDLMKKTSQGLGTKLHIIV